MEVRTEDGHIIHKCLNGDSAAFGFLVDKYKASVYAFAYSRLRNFHDAEDVAQEVFIKAYENLRKLKRWDSFLAWIYSIASNLCKNWIRAQSRRPDHEFIEDKDPETLGTSSINSYRQDLVLGSLRDALDSLPEMYSQALTLHYLGGMSSMEMARFLGASPAAIRKRLSKARSLLKEEMLAVMSTTFEEQKLQATFTFRIVEAVKRIKIHPMPRMTGLPWGLSLTTGIILTVMSLNPYLSILNPASVPTGSPLPIEMKVLKTGEIPVEVLKISQISAIAIKRGEGDGGELRRSDKRGTFLLAPQASEVKLKPRNAAAGDGFGRSVSIHNNYAIVGAVSKDDGKGAAYVFKRDGSSWKEQEMLFANDGTKEDYFGSSVAISDEFAVVGAPYDDDRGADTGSVYIFHRTGETWTQQAKLNPHGQAILWCEFGCAVAISGDYIIVGSNQEEWAEGAVYIFKRDGEAWDEQAKLASSNRAWGDAFGYSVYISGDYVVATAPIRDNEKGSAYIFKRDGDIWKEQAILTADDGEVGDWFGVSASISGDYAIVGACKHKDNIGTAYIFVRDGASWKQHAKLTSDDMAKESWFGYSVCISGDYAIVGAVKAGGKGAIYGFMREGDSWKQVSKRVASDGMSDDWFGVAVAFSGSYAIVGADEADVSGADSGAAYIYHCTEDLSFPAFSVEPTGKQLGTWGETKRTELFQNFPNPFNPETWIPFSLSESEHVTIRIYSSTGQLVRTLDLGQKPSGAYLSREKAAYWDGRNEKGEMTTSDIYFCVMEAGESIDLRKMVMVR